MEEQKKTRKPIKLATKSEHAAYFMPMLENFAEHGELNEVVKNCVGKACDLLDAGLPLYPNDFKRNAEAGVVHAEYEALSEDELEALDTEFALAGRMMSSRSFGKVIFFHVMDRTGRLQCYAEKAVLGDDAFAAFKKLDIGDIVGVQGACSAPRPVNSPFAAIPSAC